MEEQSQEQQTQPLEEPTPLADQTIEQTPLDEAHGELDHQIIKKLQEEVAEWKDKHLRLYADFENLRKRSNKERIELIKTAGEEVITALLPIADDLERAIQSLDQSKESGALAGIQLIQSKFIKTLEQKGLKPMHTIGEAFNAELHEAITEIPVQDESLKGKVADEVEKGYYLHDKVIRYAKVVVGK